MDVWGLGYAPTCCWMSKNLKKASGYINDSTSSLQELLPEITNDKCTLDKPTFISIYFYARACCWCLMMMMILAMIMIPKYSLSAVDFATRYSIRYSDFSSQPYSNPTRSQKTLLAGPWSQLTSVQEKRDICIGDDCWHYKRYWFTLSCKDLGWSVTGQTNATIVTPFLTIFNYFWPF